MWVKICANTNVEDAVLAAALGADAVGFVFAPSVRQVMPAQVAEIAAHLPDHVERVGVFAAGSEKEIGAAVREARLTTVQLHGDLDLKLVRALHADFNGRLRIIQALHWTVDDDGESYLTIAGQLHQIELDGILDRVLIDSKIGLAAGGTGRIFNWGSARDIFQRVHPGLKLILAGGLTPDNLGDALRILQPWGVDVASGTEASAGRKDPKKLAAFIRESRL